MFPEDESHFMIHEMKTAPQPSTYTLKKHSVYIRGSIMKHPCICVCMKHTCHHAVSQRYRKYPLDPPSMCGPRLMAFHPILSGLSPLQCRPPIVQHNTGTHTHTVNSRIPSSCMQFSDYYLINKSCQLEIFDLRVHASPCGVCGCADTLNWPLLCAAKPGTISST